MTEAAALPAPASTNGTLARRARNGLLILTFINLFNYLDRYVVSALVESLRKVPELDLTDARAGLLMTGFVVVYMLASPVFGALGDKRSRPRLISFGVAVWSVATMLGGLAHSFFSLFAARAAVGIGEAAYATIAPALLADYYPKDRRGRVFAFFYAAIPIGSALGYILGGFMDAKFGWRAAFLVAGGPGLLLALFVLGIRREESTTRAKARWWPTPRRRISKPTPRSARTSPMSSPCSGTRRTRSAWAGWRSGCRPSSSAFGMCPRPRRRCSSGPSW
jgi:MFS family permease